MATTPNHLWSWDITKLRGPAKWTHYYLYVILDVFSRYVAGWMIAMRESAGLAKLLLAEAYVKQGVAPGQITLHMDCGAHMRAKDFALLLSDLGVTKTHSRPYASNDNPYSESHFKTMKYRPEFPDRFASIQDSRTHCQAFFAWYNNDHHHSGIGMMTPAMVHYAIAPLIRKNRQLVLDAAFAAHPERFVNGRPTPPNAAQRRQSFPRRFGSINLAPHRQYSINSVSECLKDIDTFPHRTRSASRIPLGVCTILISEKSPIGC